MALVADREAVLFVRGWRRPQPVAEIPTRVIERVEIGSAPAGARVIPTLDLICRDGAVQGRISIHLMRFGRILPHFIRDQSLADAAHQLAIAAGNDGRTSFAKEV
jgi:hypothetical protein